MNRLDPTLIILFGIIAFILANMLSVTEGEFMIWKWLLVFVIAGMVTFILPKKLFDFSYKEEVDSNKRHEEEKK